MVRLRNKVLGYVGFCSFGETSTMEWEEVGVS